MMSVANAMGKKWREGLGLLRLGSVMQGACSAMVCLNQEEESTNELGRMMKSGMVERRVERDNNFNVDWTGKQCKVKSMGREFAPRKGQVFLQCKFICKCASAYKFVVA